MGARERACGVNEKTLRRWLAEDDAFKAELTTARQMAFEAGMARVTGLASKAIDTLESLLDAKEHPAVRLGAARSVAELAIHEDDKRVILKKLDEIESKQERQPGL